MPPAPDDAPGLDAVGCVWGVVLAMILAGMVGLLAWLYQSPLGVVEPGGCDNVVPMFTRAGRGGGACMSTTASHPPEGV